MDLDSEKFCSVTNETQGSSESTKRDLAAGIGAQAADAWHGKQLRNRVVPPPSQPRPHPKTRTDQEEAVRQRPVDCRSPASIPQTPLEAGSNVESGRKEDTQIPRGHLEVTTTSVDHEDHISKTGSAGNFILSMTSPGNEATSNLAQASAALRRVVERAEAVRSMGPAVTAESTESKMGHHVKQHNIPMELRDRATPNSHQKNGTSVYQESVQQPENIRNRIGLDPTSEFALRHLTSMMRTPPVFDGKAPREWLMQIERYHALIGMPEAVRVHDAFNYLQGPALSHYCLAAEDGTEPTTWTEFRDFILERFSYQGIGETLRRLREIRWEGSLDRLAMQFASVLAQGVPPPQTDLVRLFLARVPLHMVVALPDVEYKTWTEAKEALRRANAPRERRIELWLAEASPELIRQAEATPNLLPQDHWRSRDDRVAHRPKPTSYLDRGLTHPRRETSQSSTANAGARCDTELHTSFRPKAAALLKCYTCKGSGHKAQQCPSAPLTTRKEGAICSNCCGQGHWAKDCTSARQGREFAARTFEGKPSWKNAQGEVRPQTESGNGRA